MNSKNNTIAVDSGYNLKLTIVTGLFAAVSAAMGFALIAIPNFEMITACIFLSGLLLGPMRGMLVGLLAELIFASLNPMGMSFLPLLTAQLLSMGIAGFAGGLCANLIEITGKYKRMMTIGVIGFVITLNFDFWTTISFPLSAGFDRAQTINTLKLGIPFAIPHLLGNSAIFAILVPLVYDRVKKLIPVILILFLSVLFLPVTNTFAEKPDTSYVPQKINVLADTASGAGSEADTIEKALYYSDSESWQFIYHDDAGEVMNSFPGIYHYDLGQLGQPLYLNGPLGNGEVELFGIPMKSHYFDMTDYNLLPPGYLESVSIYPSYHSGMLSADGIISVNPEKYFYDIPYTRLDFRDGYYGLGVVDFVMSQRIHQNYGFMFGGRVSEYMDGPSSGGFRGTNLRGLFHWGFDSGTKADFVYLSNRNRAKILFTSTDRKVFRTDFYLNVEQPLGESPIFFVSHYAHSEEKLSGSLNPLEQGFDFKVRRNFNIGKFVFQPSQLYSWYILGSGFGENIRQGESKSSLGIAYPISSKIKAIGAGSLTINQNVLPSISKKLEYAASDEYKYSATAAYSEKSPPPYTRISYDDNDDLFLPGTVVWQIPSGYSVGGNENLNPQSTTSLRLFGDIKYGEFIRIKPSLFFKQTDDPLILLPVAGEESFIWDNGASTQLPGAETKIEFGRLNGFGMSLSYTYLNQENLTNFIPDNYGYIWLDYQNRAFQDELLYTIGIHGKYVGERAGVIDNVYSSLGGDDIWGVRGTFTVSDFTLFYGNENLFSKRYYLVPGYKLMHREEVWGVRWIFWN